MSSPTITPTPPGGPPQEGQSGPSAGGGQLMGAAQRLAKLSQDAQAIAQEIPAAAPQMREVINQVRQATVQMIQQQRQAQQPSPQI